MIPFDTIQYFSVQYNLIIFQGMLSFFSFFCIKVQGHLKNLVEEHFRGEMDVVIKDPILFGDYRCALSETEPRVYEDIQDYDASKALFQVFWVIN